MEIFGAGSSKRAEKSSGRNNAGPSTDRLDGQPIVLLDICLARASSLHGKLDKLSARVSGSCTADRGGQSEHSASTDPANGTNNARTVKSQLQACKTSQQSLQDHNVMSKLSAKLTAENRSDVPKASPNRTVVSS